MMNSEISSHTISVYELQEMGFDFGLDTYTIWNEEYRPILNNAILQYFMFREIGYANPNIWKYKLQTRLDLIMRNKYNALYKAKAIEFNPLYNVDMHETFTHTISNNGSNTNNGQIDFTSNINNENTISQENNTNSETNSNQLGLSSQFPSEEMMEDDLTNNLFVDSANKNKGNEISIDTNSSNSNSQTSINGVDKTINNATATTQNETQETYSKNTIGSSAGLPFSRAMIQLKDFYDEYQLDEQVIEELKDLFMNVW